MRHHGPGLPGTGRRRLGLTALRATAAAAMIFGSLTAGLSSVGAQADEDEGTYESPTYGYTLSWDPDTYTVENDVEAADNGGRDRLDLMEEDQAVLYVEGSDEWSDTDDCVETISGEIEDLDISDADPIEDADGEPFEVSDDDRSLAGYLVSDSSGDIAYVFECRSDADGEVIVAFSYLTVNVDDFVEDVYPDLGDIADSLEFAGGSGGGSPEASDDEDASPSDDEDASPSDEDEEASPSDEDEDASPSDDEDASPSDDEDASPSDGGSGGSGGVDGNEYESPTYGYGLEWDEDVWTVEDESSDDDVDQLELSSDLLALTVVGTEEYGDDIDACVDGTIEALSDQGDGDAAIFEGEDGPLVFPADDGSYTEAIITHSDGSDLNVTDLYCIVVGNDSILTLQFTALIDDYTADGTSDLIGDILDTITLP